MERVEVLDTSALVSWPVAALEGGFVVEGQRAEVDRVAPERNLSIEAANLQWLNFMSDVSVTAKPFFPFYEI